jgi:hypothetical protein
MGVMVCLLVSLLFFCFVWGGGVVCGGGGGGGGGGGARSHFTKYGCYGLTFGVLCVLPRLGLLQCQYVMIFTWVVTVFGPVIVVVMRSSIGLLHGFVCLFGGW